jgi:ankyrin repeat protein
MSNSSQTPPDQAGSPVSQFESAADAIVNGDSAALSALLTENPQLVRERSHRMHRSTLLHYISANGVEDFRQKTPPNIVEIAAFLLQAGSDVNAESDAYRGRSTTLGLAATSCHPENAGVQIPLLELLIAHGAALDGPDGSSSVNSCLHNGRGEAAEFLANAGARLDLEGSAGVGRLDIVKSYFDSDGKLLPSATPEQMRDGFTWACEFGRTEVVEFLLASGIDVGTKLKSHGATGLHWAAYGGHAAIIKLLLERGSRVDVEDETYNGTPLGWALYAWDTLPAQKKAERSSYYEAIALLVRNGAKPDPSYYDSGRYAAATQFDARMSAALRGDMD